MRHQISHMHPDHDWIEGDFDSDIEAAIEREERPRLSAQESEMRSFESAYSRWCRMPEVKAMSDLESLQSFLVRYPHFKVR